MILPRMQRDMDVVGENIKLARLRRKYSTTQVSERAGITPETLASIEAGNADISLGDYLNVLRVLNLERDIYNIATDDPLGRKLQDIELLYPKT